eukprot:CAMPEP_0114505408 /NCGR_PEP_ID=MMETSP0109-20121206/10838_1 /TAXON_ID=29199 /ORGANISM="Chlorarachnion reptans, Strain CCCM449" /LENGTH=156 /DNA_ID=CAMNT_0001683847 /DNA_START=23 /DNA_END=493 /DNA_ORIENTATION=+
MPSYAAVDQESFLPVPQKRQSSLHKTVVAASVALNVVLVFGICFLLFSGSSQVGAPVAARTSMLSKARTAMPMRNVAAYAHGPKTPMKLVKNAQLGAVSAATSAALLQGVAKAAEGAGDFIYQEGANPPLVEAAWGMLGAMFTFSIALVVFGRSGL